MIRDFFRALKIARRQRKRERIMPMNRKNSLLVNLGLACGWIALRPGSGLR